MQPMAPAEARVDRHLLLGVLERRDALDDAAAERRLQPAQRLAEGAVGPAGRAGLRAADDLDRLLGQVPLGRAHATTTIAVTSALRVASGSSTFQPKLMS